MQVCPLAAIMLDAALPFMAHVGVPDLANKL